MADKPTNTDIPGINCWYIKGKRLTEIFTVWHFDKHLYNTGTNSYATEQQAVAAIKPNGMIEKKSYSPEKGLRHQYRSYNKEGKPYCNTPFI